MGALAAFALPAIAARTGRRLNKVRRLPPYFVGDDARALHARLRIADLHADTLLWERDPLTRSKDGHVDLPRLLEGHVAFQAFTVVTQSPAGLNIHENSAEARDDITLLAMAQGWPPATWTSRLARALHQAERLHDAARRSGGRLVVVRTRGELEAALARQAKGEALVAGVLGIEGAHALDHDAANVAALDQAGFRQVGLTHFFDNEVGGSAHGVAQGGLTDLGRAVVRELEARKILIDLAHASSKLIDEVLAIATRPVIVSHTGVKGTCSNARNLSDAQLEAIAATGGVIGVGFWKTAVCGTDAAAIAKAIAHALSVVGPEHVALGSDFDGAVTTPFDASGLALVTEALMKEGLDEATIAKVMGENTLALYLRSLPE